MNKDISFYNFTGGYGESEDYFKLHDFLVESKNPEFSYARLDWMITHRPYLQEQNLHKIGMWQEKDRVVAAVLFDTSLDDIFPIVLQGYEYLYQEMLEYAKKYMGRPENPNFRLFINDKNTALQECAKQMGYHKTDEKDKVACYNMNKDIPQSVLPEGYQIVSLQEERDYEKYAECLFKGFDHEAEGEIFQFDNAMWEEQKNELERSMVDLNLKLSVKAPDQSYAAHCGMWYDKKSQFAIIEPVATAPKYRRMGLAKAVVLEGIRRTKEMGAKYAFVGSDQQFYYSIGLKPYTEGSFWVE